MQASLLFKSTIKNTLLRTSIFILLLLFSGVSFAQIKIGDKAPNINITNWIQNQPQNTILKNKFIVVDFWATWCAPCLASMAHMNTLIEENRTKDNLVFLAMSDEKKEKISPILFRVPFKASVVTDTTEQTQNNFEISSIPASVIIDDKGFIRWTGNPELLTNDIIQNILTREDLTVVNNEEIKLRRTEKQYDSLKQEYRSIFEEGNIKEYFNLGPFQKEGYGSMYAARSTYVFRKVEIGVKLRDIISELISVSSSQIALPDSMNSLYASYCYKSGKKIKSDDVLNSILTTANLTVNKTDSIQNVFFLEVSDSNLLNKNFVKTGGHEVGHLSVSDDGKFISMSNSSMFSIISALQDRFDCPIVLKDSSVFDKSLDMMLQTDNFMTLKQSMKMYGISIKEIKQSLPFVTIVHK